jgi:signal peptidase II
MFWMIMVAAVVLDQASKQLIVHLMELGESIVAIPGFLNFTYILNEGASFSILQGQRWIFIIVSIIVLILVFFALKYVPKRMRLFRAFIALFIGGMLGNFIDRLYLGAVIDFIDLGWFPIFNVADSCISISVAAICIMLLFGKPGALLDKKKAVWGND